MLTCRQQSALTFLLGAVFAAACSAPASGIDSDVAVERRDDAIWARDADGEPVTINDTTGPSRNLVVRIPTKTLPAGKSDIGCTGVLLTPSLVLTSKHCVGPTKGTLTPEVEIGSKLGGFVKRTALSVTQMASAPSVAGLDAGDLVLIKLAMPKNATEAYLVPSLRPTLATPLLSAGVAVPAPPGGNREVPKIEMVGWSPFAIDENGETVAPTYAVQNRQAGVLENAYLNWLTADGIAPFFVREVYAPLRPGTARLGLHSGDVGSPLYYYDSVSSTKRQLVGLATAVGMATTPASTGEVFNERAAPSGIPGTRCDLSRCDVWADLTTAVAKTFIESNAVLTVGERWKRFHLRSDGLPNHWYGENDTAGGSCEPGVSTLDPDCDGWYNLNASLSEADFYRNRDNCPAHFNPDQADRDDDGKGDACDSCSATPDDADCDGRANAIDNCPTEANPGWADQDSDGIGDACDRCSDIADTSMELQACTPSCATNWTANNDSIGVLVDGEGTRTSPASYGSRNCDSRWIFEFYPSKMHWSYAVVTMRALMQRQDYQTAGLDARDAGRLDPRRLCEESSLSAELWARRISDRQWVKIEAANTGFTWDNSGRCEGFFCTPKCPANTFCPENCWAHGPVQARLLEQKIPRAQYDRARYIGSFNAKRQVKTDVVNSNGPMQGTLWNDQPPR
jgi:hypothetical protein